MRRYINSPLWDGIWIWSALPMAAVVCAFYSPWMFTIILILDSMHVFAPIVMAWSHREYRSVMLADKDRFIILPLLILIAAASVAPMTYLIWPDFHPRFGFRLWIPPQLTPFTILVGLFFAWNLYHFGMQNFGVLSLYDWIKKRWLRKVLCLLVTIIGVLVVPKVLRGMSLSALAPFTLAFFSVNHSMAAIGLSGLVIHRHSESRSLPLRGPSMFYGFTLLCGLATLGVLWFGIFYLDSLLIAMTVVSLRMGVGIVHFLYDRWVWKFSDPFVRATIGVDLFSVCKTIKVVGG